MSWSGFYSSSNIFITQLALSFLLCAKGCNTGCEEMRSEKCVPLCGCCQFSSQNEVFFVHWGRETLKSNLTPSCCSDVEAYPSDDPGSWMGTCKCNRNHPLSDAACCCVLITRCCLSHALTSVPSPIHVSIISCEPLVHGYATWIPHGNGRKLIYREAAAEMQKKSETLMMVTLSEISGESLTSVSSVFSNSSSCRRKPRFGPAHGRAALTAARDSTQPRPVTVMM